MSMPINLTWKVSIRRIRCILYLFRTNDNISQSNNPNLQQASSLTALATISRSVKRIITTDTFSKVCSSTLGQFAASARFDGDVRSQTSGGISAVQRHQRLRAPENSNCPGECKERAARVKKVGAKWRGRRTLEASHGATTWCGSCGGE